MTSIASASRASEVPFSDDEFQRLATLAHREFGITLSPSKKPLVYSRLSKRLRACSMNSFTSYLEYVEKTDSDDERSELISALTTNVTSFFREAHHFDTLTKQLIPELKQKQAGKQRLRFWSAGCSSGQEAYSIVMSILDTWPEAATNDFKVLATDIDPKIVATAKAGSYDEDAAKTIPAAMRERWTEPDPTAAGQIRMKDSLRKHLSFGELNLIKPWPMKGPFDAIFCRNVAIYFETATQQTLWQRFVDLLSPGGFLFIGHSERVTGSALPLLTVSGVTTYRKPAPGERSTLERSAG
jgi:chemotaxis protein methyltransferase CheR